MTRAPIHKFPNFEGRLPKTEDFVATLMEREPQNCETFKIECSISSTDENIAQWFLNVERHRAEHSDSLCYYVTKFRITNVSKNSKKEFVID